MESGSEYHFFSGFQAALPTLGRYAKFSVRKYLRKVGANGFEPSTSASRTQRSVQAELRPVVVITSHDCILPGTEGQRLMEKEPPVLSRAAFLETGWGIQADLSTGWPGR